MAARGAVARGKKIAKCLPRRKKTTDKNPRHGKVKGQFVVKNATGEPIPTRTCFPKMDKKTGGFAKLKDGDNPCRAYPFPHARGRGKCVHPAPAGAGSCGGRKR